MMHTPIGFTLPQCSCTKPDGTGNQFYTKMLGIDTTASRHAEVFLKSCRQCDSLWIEYFYENEAFSQSGRWYRGIIPLAHALTIAPTDVVSYLENLEWYIFGGSFFKTGPSLGSGKLHL